VPASSRFGREFLKPARKRLAVLCEPETLENVNLIPIPAERRDSRRSPARKIRAAAVSGEVRANLAKRSIFFSRLDADAPAPIRDQHAIAVRMPPG